MNDSDHITPANSVEHIDNLKMYARSILDQLNSLTEGSGLQMTGTVGDLAKIRKSLRCLDSDLEDLIEDRFQTTRCHRCGCNMGTCDVTADFYDTCNDCFGKDY